MLLSRFPDIVRVYFDGSCCMKNKNLIMVVSVDQEIFAWR